MIPTWLDVLNAGFELGGSYFAWSNVRQLRRDRRVMGFDWKSMMFYTAWGSFNVVLYPSLGMFASAIAGVVLCLGNLTWTLMALNAVMSVKKTSPYSPSAQTQVDLRES